MVTGIEYWPPEVVSLVEVSPLPQRPLYAIRKFAILLLVVVCRQSTSGTKGQRNRCPASRLDYPGDSRAGKKDAVSEGKLGAIVLIGLEEVA